MMWFRRRHSSDDLTGDQRERMAVFSLSGETEGPAMTLARRHLEFSRDLAQHGRIGETDTSGAVGETRRRVWGDDIEQARHAEAPVPRRHGPGREGA